MFQTFLFSGAWDSSRTVLLENTEAKKGLNIQTFPCSLLSAPLAHPGRVYIFRSCPFIPFCYLLQLHIELSFVTLRVQKYCLILSRLAPVFLVLSQQLCIPPAQSVPAFTAVCVSF